MWSVWWRAMVGALLVALGASLELYDTLPATDDLLYQDLDKDTGPSDKMPLPRVNDVVMRKLFKALQMQRLGAVRIPNRPHPQYPHPLPLEEVDQQVDHAPDSKLFKSSVFKRLAEVFGSSNPAQRALDAARLQQKWKIKKGKSLGSQMVCYFKLCAFRSPANVPVHYW
ncbi:hypothetical protein ABMA27_016851 [Loxostege sticticalis]|uniref:Uncharacterized protein n=1 Tax=Loxostege sticticalis TaxID=481309 RepID=A0ABR3I3V1_LOXSC